MDEFNAPRKQFDNVYAAINGRIPTLIRECEEIPFDNGPSMSHETNSCFLIKQQQETTTPSVAFVFFGCLVS